MPVRIINYPKRNCVGLSPVSGMLDDSTPTMRARWALLFGERGIEPAYAATYGETVMEHSPAPCALANVYGKHHGGSRVETRELPIVRRVVTTEFPIVTEHYKIGGVVVDVPAHLLPVVDPFAPSWSDDMRKHVQSFIDAGVPLDEPGDILLSEHDVIEDNCPECGSNGNCVRSCPVGGEL